MEKQTANTILMVRPVAFGFNVQTADNNYFQQQDNAEASKIQEQALREFDAMTQALEAKGVNLIIVEDTLNPHTPDSIFPNNWVTFHGDGRIALYPMYAENRRLERRPEILEQIKKAGYPIIGTTDYSASEQRQICLEGTGSMILDRPNKTAYAALSQRTDKDLFEKFCADFGFKPVYFQAYQTVQGERLPIYHTNVMMCIGDKYALVCLDTIDDPAERKKVSDSFTANEKEIIEITQEQMYQFAGNMLQVENDKGEKFLVMSDSACKSLNSDQIKRLSAYNEIVSVAIPTIERYGGGSARCMMAEVFLPRK